MFIFLTILILLAALLLILVVVIQNSKGGGLAAGFDSSNKYMGVRKTTDFLEKATWWLAGALVVLSIVSSHFLHSAATVENAATDIQKAAKKVEVPQQLPIGLGDQQPSNEVAMPTTDPAPATEQAPKEETPKN